MSTRALISNSIHEYRIDYPLGTPSVFTIAMFGGALRLEIENRQLREAWLGEARIEFIENSSGQRVGAKTYLNNEETLLTTTIRLQQDGKGAVTKLIVDDAGRRYNHIEIALRGDGTVAAIQALSHAENRRIHMMYPSGMSLFPRHVEGFDLAKWEGVARLVELSLNRSAKKPEDVRVRQKRTYNIPYNDVSEYYTQRKGAERFLDYIQVFGVDVDPVGNTLSVHYKQGAPVHVDYYFLPVRENPARAYGVVRHGIEHLSATHHVRLFPVEKPGTRQRQGNGVVGDITPELLACSLRRSLGDRLYHSIPGLAQHMDVLQSIRRAELQTPSRIR